MLTPALVKPISYTICALSRDADKTKIMGTFLNHINKFKRIKLFELSSIFYILRVQTHLYELTTRSNIKPYKRRK